MQPFRGLSCGLQTLLKYMTGNQGRKRLETSHPSRTVQCRNLEDYSKRNVVELFQGKPLSLVSWNRLSLCSTLLSVWLNGVRIQKLNRLHILEYELHFFFNFALSVRITLLRKHVSVGKILNFSESSCIAPSSNMFWKELYEIRH